MTIDVSVNKYGRFVVLVDGRRAYKWRESSRCVFRSVKAGVVVKVGRSGQCESELERWTSFTPEQRKLVAPIVAHGTVRGQNHKIWIAQQYVEGTFPEYDSNEWAAALRAFRKLGVFDDHDQNALVTPDGSVVVVDFAI